MRAAAVESGPIDALQGAILQFHLDDLGFEDHLPTHGQVGGFEILLHGAQLTGQRPHHHHTGLGTRHHAATLAGTDDGGQCGFQVFPEITLRRRLDLAARQGGRARLLHGGRPQGSGLDRGPWGRDGTGTHQHFGASLALRGQIVDLEHPRLQREGLNEDTITVDLVIVAVQLADRRQGLRHGHVLQAHRYVAGDLRMHQHAVAGAGNDAHEHLPRRRIVHQQIEARLQRITGGRRHFHGQRRDEGLGHRLGLGAPLVVGDGTGQRLVDVFDGLGARRRCLAAGQQHAHQHRDARFHGRSFLAALGSAT